MDQMARDVVAAAPFTTDADLQRWLQRFGDECKALAANGDEADWSQFKDTLTAWTEDDIPAEVVERFIEYVDASCSTPMDVLKQIGESGEDLAQVYSENLGWISPGQRSQLDQLWEIRGDWREWLPAELDDRWPDWRTSTPDVLAPWLDEVLPSLLLSSGAAEEAESDTPLDESVWAEYLKQWDGDWDGSEETWQNFAERVVYYAPDGWQSTAQELVDYVGSQPDKAACITDVYGIALAPAGAAAAADVTQLDWVTPEQQSQLADEEELRGGSWRDWLPAELDVRIGHEWRTWTAAELTARLDMIIPMLVLPAEDHDVAKVFVDNLNAVLEDETVQEYMGEFDEGELLVIMQEAKELAMAEAGVDNE